MLEAFLAEEWACVLNSFVPFMAESPELRLRELIATTARLQLEAPNEAKTRLEVVDRVLVDVLGWSLRALNPETPASGDGKKREWLDYHLQTPEGAGLVVEAKRLGTTFSFSATKKLRTYRLHSLKTSHGAPLTAVLSQAAKYCSATGTFPFVVTNGVQWIGSVFAWPNVPAEKIEAVVFHSLDDVLANFTEFYDCFSPDGLVAGHLNARAVQTRGLAPTSATSLNLKVPYNPPPKEVNYLSGPIESLLRSCFDELSAEKDEEMLRFCYVRNDLTDGYVARLETFVGQTVLFDSGLTAARPLERAKFARDPADSRFAKALTNHNSALLLVGRIGSGKSTFIEYAVARLREAGRAAKLFLLRLDLRSQTQLGSDNFDHDKLRNEIAQALLQQSADLYPHWSPYEYDNQKGIFSSEIQRELSGMPPALREKASDESIYQLICRLRLDPYYHAKQYLKYLHSNRGLAVAVMFDNIDRGSIEFERAIFSIARDISATTGTTTLTALRDTTYHTEKSLGFLDVSQYEAFTLSPPPFASVLSKRLDFARNVLLDNDKMASQLVRGMHGYSIETVRGFVEAIAEIVGGANSEIRECIQALSATDVRRSLELLRFFLTSANTDIERLMKDYNRGYAKQPLTMLLRSLMCGNASRYIEKASPIFNLFQVSATNLESHFTAIRVLQYLDHMNRDSRAESDIPIRTVVSGVATLGILPDTAEKVVDRMGRSRLVLSRSRPEPPWSNEDSIRIAAAGKFYLDALLYEHEYIRNVTDDSILYDQDVSSSILELHNDRDLSWQDRSGAKTKLFVEYLLGRERVELATLADASQKLAWCLPVMPTLAERLFGAAYLRERSRRRPTRKTGGPRARKS
jgi:hypothetical protein